MTHKINMVPAPTHFDTETLTFWRQFNVEYQAHDGGRYHFPIFARDWDHAERRLEELKASMFIHDGPVQSKEA